MLNYLRNAVNCGSNKQFEYIIKNKWLDDICSHMKNLGNIKSKCIYVYEFKDNSAYIGLTCNIERRNKEHFSQKNSSVFKHINKTNLIPKLIQLTDYVYVEYSIKLEDFYLQKYKNNNWNILNKSKTGATGKKSTIWNYENCKNEALKYKYRKEFQTNNISAYLSSLKNKWLDDICSHMIEKIKQKGYWNYDKCKEIALIYKNKTDFRIFNFKAYSYSQRNNFLKEICSHMHLKNKKQNG